MFRKVLTAAFLITCGLCSTGVLRGQDMVDDGAEASPLAERLQNFRRSITGTGGTKGNAAPSGAKRRPTQPAQRKTPPKQQPLPEYDPYAEDYEEGEFFPSTGIGDFFNNLTGRGEKTQPAQTQPSAQRPVSQPRSGSAARATSPGVRTSRTSPAGRGMAARTQNYNAQPAARPAARATAPGVEQASAATTDYRPLQERLANARRTNRPAPTTAAPERVAQRPTETNDDRATWTSGEQPAPPPPPAQETPAAEPVAARPTHSGDEVLFTRQSAQLNVGTAGPKSVVIGKPATYRVVVQNPGAHAANSVTVSVRLPNWTEVVGSKATSGGAAVSTSTPGLIEWQLDEVSARSQETLSLEIVPRQSQAFELAVGWTQQPQSAHATVQVQEPKLKMDIEGPTEVYYGENQVYKLTLSNPGTGAADNVEICLLPIGQGTEAPATHNVGTLEAGASQTLEIELTPRQAGELVIKAEATADGDLRCEAVEEVLVRRAGLAADLAGPRMQYAGTVATYEVQVSNPGNAAAKDVVVSAELPSGAEFQQASGGGRYNAATGAVEWSLTSLQAGADELLTVKCVLATPGVNNVNLKATAAGDLACEGQTITRVEALADLVLEVSDPRGPVGIGQDVTYQVKVSNRGTKSASGVDVIAFFSQGVEAVAVEGGDHKVSPGQVEFNSIPTIDAGGEVTFSITARADMAGNHVFRAEVHCKSLGTSLASEETTKFYAEGVDLESDAISPAPAVEDEELSPTPVSE